MIVLHEGAAAYRAKKPMICTKCRRGKMGIISAQSVTNISRRGRLPPDREEGIEIKCPVCGCLWTVTIE